MADFEIYMIALIFDDMDQVRKYSATKINAERVNGAFINALK